MDRISANHPTASHSSEQKAALNARDPKGRRRLFGEPLSFTACHEGESTIVPEHVAAAWCAL
ncbi:hypothetical protein [Haloglycomyces albus]|uniref:hypothetical protein n=1 Tax=Haloglycomyces albus TaxID=526067 RepID=UPI0012EC9597|nr:hypothetical protein [Haloglycomyces albus]